MKRIWMARVLALALLMTLLLPAAGVAAKKKKVPTYSMSMGVKETFQIDVTAFTAPEGKLLKFKSKNSKIVSVDETGTITAKKKGTTQVAVGYDKTALAICTIKVVAAPKKITLSDTSAVLSIGKTKKLKATLPKNTASALSYASSDEAVAKVDKKGKITAVAAGTATITVSTFNKKTASCEVTVLSGSAPTELSVNATKVNLQVKETFKLIPSVDVGADAAYKFSSKDKKIAKVAKDGTITGVKKGTTKITVTTHNGLKKTVTVKVRSKLSLKEVYGYLANTQEGFLANAQVESLQQDTEPQEGSVMYYSDQLALIMTANSCRVCLNTAATPRYCIQGIHTGMNLLQAIANMYAADWTLYDTVQSDSNGATTWHFIKDGDKTHEVQLTSDDGAEIMTIEALWTW